MQNHSGAAKSNAAHRIIKEGVRPTYFSHAVDPTTSKPNSNVVVPLLPPMPLPGNNNTTHNAAIAAALAMQSHRDNTSNVDNIDKYKRRVKELEQENCKLKNHLKESEDAIKNYRGFLSHRPNETPRTGNNSKIDMYSQTIDANWLMSDALKIAEEKIKLLEIEKKNANNEIQTLKRRADSGGGVTALPVTQSSVIVAERSDADGTPQALPSPTDVPEKHRLQETIHNLQRKIEELEIKVSQSSVTSQDMNASTTASNSNTRHATPNSAATTSGITVGDVRTASSITTTSTSALNTPSTKCELHKHIEVLYKSVNSLKKSQCDDKEIYRQVLDTFSQEFATSSSTSSGIINKLLEKIGLLNNEITLLKSRYNDTIADRQSVETLLSDKETMLMNVNVELDMLRLKYVSVNEKLNNIQVPVIPVHKHQGCDPLSPVAAKVAQHQDTITRLQSDIEQQKSRINEYQNRLRDACNCLYRFQEIHFNEVAAVKHIAHVKDLGRVAAMRESTIEHDRVMSELKYAKDLNNVLSFSLQTAEEVLQESQPHVVTKLLESRTKRMKSLEKAATERRKEVDQRSAETCAVNTQHLEGFQVKAQEKHDGIQKEYQDVIQSLIKVFYVDDIEMKVFIDKKKRK